MRLGIKGKQVLGVTSIVAAVVVVLSLLHLARLASVSLAESKARADLMTLAIYQRTWYLIQSDPNPTTLDEVLRVLRDDHGLRSILESSMYSRQVTFAAIADPDDIAVVHQDQNLQNQRLPPGDDLAGIVLRSQLSQLLAVYSGQGRNLEVRLPVVIDGRNYSIRVGISTLLIRSDLDSSLRPAIAAALIALAVSVFVAMLLAQLVLRPIHVLRSGLGRLGRGEFGVRLDLKRTDEFGELGTFFNAVSDQLSADRSHMAGQVANLESAVEHLGDAVAIIGSSGELLFVNPAMRGLVPNSAVGSTLHDLLPPNHPLLALAEQTLLAGRSRGPVQAALPALDGGEPVERLMMSHVVTNRNHELVGIMLVARDLAYLGQVQSTIRYSRKLAALGRLSAGVAHEVKNPLNAMMIHLELLRHQFTAGTTAAGAVAGAARGSVAVVGRGRAVGTVAAPRAPVDTGEALQHVDIIASEIRRLDEVVQGFLKFSRPEDLKLQPVQLSALFDEILPVVRPQADRCGVELAVDCDGVPDINADPAMLRQAFLNLALNACQAMPGGGTLRIQCQSAAGRRVAVSFADSGVGIDPAHLPRIFDLYFTTKEGGSGIGLSMVYRTVQMHDGEIEVQSTPGAGTTFRLLLPQA